MRIAYGVFGYGRGHATRAGAVLETLVQHHEVLILAGADAYAALSPRYDVIEIPTLGYHYNTRGRLSSLLTLQQNTGKVLELLGNGRSVQNVAGHLRRFRAEVVISDAEPWTHRAARSLNIPRIGFDHFGIMVYCRPPLGWRDRVLSQRDIGLYRALMGRPQRAIVSSFYDAPVKNPGVHMVGPLLRREVFEITPGEGDYLLAYFNQGRHQFHPYVREALQTLGVPVYVYGTGLSGADGHLHFFPPGDRAFLEHLAGCRALISTAGNQLVGEALHFGKPMLVMPEDCVEQRLNAMALERLGIGMQIPLAQLSATVIQSFLARGDDYREAIRRHRHDGRREALHLLEGFFRELVPHRSGHAGARETA
jgi:uncharacterized protein (TIGR00661 family)